MPPPSNPGRFVKAISASRLTIYDPIQVGDPDLWIPAPELEVLLDRSLRGRTLAGLALRTRSKVVKEYVCRALGYPVPVSFKKSKPRFPGQAFDTYSQKSNNLQIWNEELVASRRYVLLRVSDTDVIERVKVVTGDTLALLDTTGTLTQKYQARCIPTDKIAELISVSDTNLLQPLVAPLVKIASVAAPINYPAAGELLTIDEVFRRLQNLIGQRLPNIGSVQERNRGAGLHRLVCRALGYAEYQDDGRFPDVRHQLLEVKLQTSPTIDLGLVRPDSTEPLDVPQIGGKIIRHCDVRYCIFYGRIEKENVVRVHSKKGAIPIACW